MKIFIVWNFVRIKAKDLIMPKKLLFGPSDYRKGSMIGKYLNLELEVLMIFPWGQNSRFNLLNQ
jgi:hypothetical protein